MRTHRIAVALCFAVVLCGIFAFAQNETNTTNETTNTTIADNTTINTTAQSGTVNVMVMKHVCGPEIQSEADLDRLGDSVSQEIACPAVVLTKDGFSTNSIHGDQTDFNIAVQGESGALVPLSGAAFTQAKACETDLNRDVNNDNRTDATQCLDTSFYTFSNVVAGNVTISELTPVPGTRLGAVRLGPAAKAQEMLVSTTGSAVQLDTRNDTNDTSFMVHVFDFRNNEGNVVTRIFSNIFSPIGATLTIKPPYPKGNEFVFVCNVNGFTPTSYSWFYGDGSKLIDIQNGDTFHRYSTPGTYEVTCMGSDGNNTASASLTVNVTTATNETFTNTGVCTTGLTCDGQALNVSSCQTISCTSLCTADVCFSNVTSVQVCPNQQFVNTGFTTNQTNVSANVTTNLSATCFNTVEGMPASCVGGTITQDTNLATFDNCRHTTCSNGNDSLTVMACEKPDEVNPQFFELSKENQVGSSISRVCIGDTCVGDNGFAMSGDFPICTGAVQQPLNLTETNVTLNTTNVTVTPVVNVTQNVTENTTTNTTV